MSNLTLVQQHTENNICILTLNRPKKHNALNVQLITELKYTLQQANKEENIRVIIVKSEGKNFCAGVDLNWMKHMSEFSREKNEADILVFSDLLQLLSCSSKPTIASIQGSTMGGGIGLVACCDIAIAAKNAKFCFSELKLGLIPATIAPYIIRSIGYSSARRYFLTAETFDTLIAEKIGLIHQIVNENELTSESRRLAELIIQNNAFALSCAKNLLNDLSPINKTVITKAAVLLSEICTSKTACKSIQKFLKKEVKDFKSRESCLLDY